MSDDNEHDDDLFERRTGKSLGIGGDPNPDVSTDDDTSSRYGGTDEGFEEDKELWLDDDEDQEDGESN